MFVWLGTFGFGMVIGWVAAFVYHHSRALLRELKGLLAILFGAALQAIFGVSSGIIVYGVGVTAGTVLYVITLLFRSLRRAHEIKTL
jgi:hypothetical protein